MRLVDFVFATLMFIFLSFVIIGYGHAQEGTSVIGEVGDGIWMDLNTGHVFIAPSTGAEGFVYAYPFPGEQWSDHMKDNLDTYIERYDD